ncbi:polyphosphate kinase 2 family protein [Pseudorhodoplanes sp.]|uniref:polyphosphate kinase 2 family protein n=1 Tax=Pseudorhodoplanes sp. TaxID=1934341 RepID=UPI002BCF7BFF|nr:polyphosphate kinase 2 family protein [Pseudorhodoplanes sp.]HWV53594.1 polyphosphate kinase 2 family protein [Pseudorhodoplanes sp.]
MKIETLARRYRVDNPDRFRLSDIDPGDSAGLAIDKDEAREMLKDSIRKLADFQDMLYAQDRWAVLAIFQAMDAAGKDSAVEHVMSGVNPQGCQVYSFKTPTSQELDHDFMWRTTVAMPERGRIGIFNRSYYEEVLVVRAHPDILAKQKLPPKLVGKDIWKERFEDIRAFEKYHARNGTLILKFFLHVSKDEQAARFLERIDDPAKNWKFNLGDLSERKRWDDYMRYYEETIRETSRPHAPWFVVPADKKWFTRLVVASALVEALESLDLHYPRVDDATRAELQEARVMLVAELPEKKKNGKKGDNKDNARRG